MKRILCILLFLPLLAFGDMPRGEKLVNRLWKDIKIGNVKKIRHYTSKNFQAIALNSVFNRKQQMDYLKNLQLNTYKIVKLRVTESENVITVYYMIVLTGQNLPPFNLEETYFYQLNVWKKFGHTWKWVAEGRYCPWD